MELFEPSKCLNRGKRLLNLSNRSWKNDWYSYQNFRASGEFRIIEEVLTEVMLFQHFRTTALCDAIVLEIESNEVQETTIHPWNKFQTSSPTLPYIPPNLFFAKQNHVHNLLISKFLEQQYYLSYPIHIEQHNVWAFDKSCLRSFVTSVFWDLLWSMTKLRILTNNYVFYHIGDWCNG